MNRPLAHALGATALGALLLLPVTSMASPPAGDRDGHSAWHHSYSNGDERYRDDDRDDWRRHDHAPRRGYVVHHLPPRYRPVHHHGRHYYYAGGAWYRPYGSRYVVVDPPVGLVVPFLPQFSSTVRYRGVPHYRAGPVYYVWHPRARGYVVTDGPYRRW